MLGGINYREMTRIGYPEVKNLKVGDVIYYRYTHDQTPNALYEATVIGKYPHILTLDCELIPDSVEGVTINPLAQIHHVESVAYIEAFHEMSTQRLFKNISYVY